MKAQALAKGSKKSWAFRLGELTLTLPLFAAAYLWALVYLFTLFAHGDTWALVPVMGLGWGLIRFCKMVGALLKALIVHQGTVQQVLYLTVNVLMFLKTLWESDNPDYREVAKRFKLPPDEFERMLKSGNFRI